MAEKHLFDNKYVAASKPAFFLSEVFLTLKPLAVHELFYIISPKLPALDSWQKNRRGF